MPTDPNPFSSIAEARTHIEQAMTNHECPFCGSGHWLPQEPDRAFLVQEAILDSAGEDASAGKYTVGIGYRCNGCGFLRIHVPTFPEATTPG
jgi:predicted RNA-binding Zn-ribbon protein involved in translation (DUF1610 family)